MRLRYTLSQKDQNWAKTAEQREASLASTRTHLKSKGLSGRRLGMKMRDATLSTMKSDPEYMRGMGQGRLDAACELDYSEERSESSYNLGYYRGYTNYYRDTRGGLVMHIEQYEEMN